MRSQENGEFVKHRNPNRTDRMPMRMRMRSSTV